MSGFDLLGGKYEDYVIKMRREFHEHPEVAMKEKETSERIIKAIESLGLEYEIVEPYGIIATMKGGNPGKTVLLRADMDALPIQEDPSNLAGPKVVVSKNPGVGHLCGHDAHMAMLLGAMKVLDELKNSLCGTVLFCFEEGEETGGGVEAILDSLADKTVDACWGIHVYSELPSGKISVDPGPRMSASGGFSVTVRGRGGHGSRPDQTIDPIQCTAQIIVNLSSILSRELNPMEPGVVTVGFVKSGEVGNVIPDTATFGGTCRSFDLDVGLKIKEAFFRITENIAAAHRCTVDINYRGPNLPVINDPTMSAVAAESIKNHLGEDCLTTCDPWMASESFGRYLNKYPGVFAFLGIANPAIGTGAPHHNPKFDVDESVLKLGVSATVQFVLDFLACR